MSPNFLNQSELDMFADLLLRSRQAESFTRETLCRKLGIDPKRVGFINKSGDYYFALELINYLNEIDDREALCQLCQELHYVFNKGKFAPILMEIAAKLNCDLDLKQNYPNRTAEQPNSPSVGFTPELNVNLPYLLDEPKSQSWLKKMKNAKYQLLIGGAVFLTGLAGFLIYGQIKFSNPRYAHLNHLLEQERWEEADRETANQMWDVAGKRKERILHAEDFEKFPCEHLGTIDNLWTKYSNQHFGFSVQRSIWKSSEVNSRLDQFMSRVGWVGEEEKDNKKVIFFVPVTNFSLSAPQGQLPWLVTWQGSDGIRDRNAYMSRIAKCFP